MTTAPKSGEAQAQKKLKNGLDPSIGKATQFKPGESGNPAGMPKGTKHINTWIQELAEDEDFTAFLFDARDGYIEFKGAPIKAIVRQTVVEALSGKNGRERQAARDWLAKYGWPTKNELDAKIKGDITVQLVNYDAGSSTPQL